MLNNVGGVRKLQAQAYTDAGAWVAGQNVSLPDGPQNVEIEYAAASAAGADDGLLKLYLNDALGDTISAVDNDTRSLDTVSLGVVNGLDAGTSGMLYFDAFESRHTSHIGPLAAA